MTATNHHGQFEELMAWLDGELPAADADRVRAHVEGCAECRQMEGEMRGVSGRLAQWHVPAPASLRLPAKRVFGLTRSNWMQVAAMLVLVSGVAIWAAARRSAAPPPMQVAVGGAPAELAYSERAADSAFPGEGPNIRVGATKPTRSAPRSAAQVPTEAIVGGSGPLLVRTATLSLVPGNFDTARTEIERIVAAAGGFTGRIMIADAQRGARSLNATLRIPTAKLDDTLAALRALGHVTSESQDGEDVTQQSIDLDARLSNARASEARLQDILANRTGRLSDVLEVERELSRVRGEIEGMEAQRKSLDRRITYANVTIRMEEERKAAVDLGPLPISTQLRNALVDGWSMAITSALDAVVVVARIAPVVLLWTVLLAPPLWLIKRRLARQ